MDASQFQAAAHAAIHHVTDYYENISDYRVVSNVAPGYLGRLLPTEMPEKGEPWDAIQKDLADKILPGITHWQSPNFLAFFPANSTYAAILGELYCAAFNCPNFNWQCSPASTELETIVLDWLCRLMSLPPCYLSTSSSGGGGVINATASEAIVTVIVAARDRALRALSSSITDDAEKERFTDQMRSKLVALGSDQTHSSTQKGCMITGTKYRSIKVKRDPISQNFTLTASTLRSALEAATAEGLVPFYTTVSLGTTSTCAVDAFAEIAEVAKDYPNLWIHVDAAYAGAALVCPEYQHLIKGVEAFDSFNMNMHKWLLTNIDCSCLFVKERKHLINALSITPSYLRNEFSERGLVTDYRDWQIPLGNRFRSLKVWFVMRTYGAEGLRRHIRNCLAVGTGFYERVKKRPDLFTIFTPPAFGLTVFSVNVDGDLKARNDITKEVYEAVNAHGEIFITSAVVDGTYTIRVVSGNPRAEDRHLARAFDIIVAKTEEANLKRRRAQQIEKEIKVYKWFERACTHGLYRLS